MSQPCTSPPEFAKYSVLPEIATELSIDTSRADVGQELVVPPGRVEHELGRDGHEPVGARCARLSLTMWIWLFSPPSNR